MTQEETIIDRIHKLLRLANDRGATSGEAESAAAMAAKLMARYAIDQEKLAQQKPQEDDLRDYIRQDVELTKFAKWEYNLLLHLTWVNRCRLVRQSWKPGHHRYAVIGRREAVEGTLEVHRWLREVIHKLAQKAYRENAPENDFGYGEKMDPHRFHVSFKNGAVVAITNRLQEERYSQEREQSRSDSQALVIVGDKTLRAMVREFPSLSYLLQPVSPADQSDGNAKPTKVRKVRLPKYRNPYAHLSAEAFSAGRQAGDSVPLHQATGIEEQQS